MFTVAAGVGLSLGVTCAFQLSFFLAALALRTDVFTDFAGTSNFLLLFLLSYFLGQPPLGHCSRTAVVTGLAALWALRLGGFLLARILIWGKDNRFDKMRENPAMWAGFWVLQALWVWGTSLPVVMLNSGQFVCQPVWALDCAAWTLMLGAALLEGVADLQKLRFKRREENVGKWCDAGLWRFSRHPNYFFEMVFWWAAYAACCAGFRGGTVAPFLVGALGPLTVSGLLLFLSGVPLLEDSADTKHGSNAAYVDYKASTSPLVPLPRNFYRNLPSWAKKYILFEWDMYSRTQKKLQESLVA